MCHVRISPLTALSEITSAQRTVQNHSLALDTQVLDICSACIAVRVGRYTRVVLTPHAPPAALLLRCQLLAFTGCPASCFVQCNKPYSCWEGSSDMHLLLY